MPANPSEQLRQHAMHMLAESFSTFYEHAVAVDREHRITWISDSYCRFLGLDRPPIGELITHHVENSFLPGVVDSGVPVLLDLLNVRNQWVIVSSLPLHDDHGRIIGGFGFVAIDDSNALGRLADKYNRLRRELDTVTHQLTRERQSRYHLSQIVGRSQKLKSAKEQIRKAARYDISVLITGETGTGKELFAHALHRLSLRANRPFVSINMSAIPETLMEAEFFGVAPGAYTGASKEGRRGKIALAKGGTLFLDEIGTLPLDMQSKLLRLLQEQEYEPLGSDKLVKADVRIVAATSSDLNRMMAEGTFRQDLYYRLSGMPIHLPALRERLEDIDLIAEKLLDDLTARLQLRPHYLNQSALAFLTTYHWPGNVRELQNVLERALILSENNPELDATLLNDLIQPTPSATTQLTAIPAPEPAHQPMDASLSLKQQVQRTEQAAIEYALQRCQFHKTRAARMLGISRAALYEKMQRFGLSTTAEH